jgi:hypothetical protein
MPYAFSKKRCYIQKMKTNNVWGKKRSAADCSTKQNRMAFCPNLLRRGDPRPPAVLSRRRQPLPNQPNVALGFCGGGGGRWRWRWWWRGVAVATSVAVAVTLARERAVAVALAVVVAMAVALAVVVAVAWAVAKVSAVAAAVGERTNGALNLRVHLERVHLRQVGNFQFQWETDPCFQWETK